MNLSSQNHFEQKFEMRKFEFSIDGHKDGETITHDNFLISIHKDIFSIWDTIHKIKVYEGGGPYIHKPRNFVCFYKQYFHYFEDYFESFREQLGFQRYLYEQHETQKYSPFDRYFFFQYGPKPEPNFILINTEQVSRPEYLSNANRVLH